MIVRDKDDRFSHIGCDGKGCKARSPKGFHQGLIALGWRVGGGLHLCPKHRDQETQDGQAVQRS